MRAPYFDRLSVAPTTAIVVSGSDNSAMMSFNLVPFRALYVNAEVKRRLPALEAPASAGRGPPHLGNSINHALDKRGSLQPEGGPLRWLQTLHMRDGRWQ